MSPIFSRLRTHSFSLPLPVPRKKRVFAFDLDGTITTEEILPRIARLAGLEAEIEKLTRLTLLGEIPFEQSFRIRFDMLRHIPVSEIQACVSDVPLNRDIERFIGSRPQACAVVTGNLDLWIMPVLERLGCRYFASRGRLTPGGPVLCAVLDKAKAARRLRLEYDQIIAVGESVSDVPLFKEASLGIAFGGVHDPVPEIRRLAALEAGTGGYLCRILNAMA